MDYNVAIITVSDKGYAGDRLDISGDAAVTLCDKYGYTLVYRTIVPDEISAITEAIIVACDSDADLVLTTGGTGMSPRDVTPEATLALLDKHIYGISEALRTISLRYTPRAMLSRGVSGIRGKSLIVNLPGSPKAVTECLDYALDTLKHGIDIIQERAAECAR